LESTCILFFPATVNEIFFHFANKFCLLPIVHIYLLGRVEDITLEKSGNSVPSWKQQPCVSQNPQSRRNFINLVDAVRPSVYEIADQHAWCSVSAWTTFSFSLLLLTGGSALRNFRSRSRLRPFTHEIANIGHILHTNKYPYIYDTVKFDGKKIALLLYNDHSRLLLKSTCNSISCCYVHVIPFHY